MKYGILQAKAFCEVSLASYMAEDWVLPRMGHADSPLRVCVFISGSGSGMDALIRYQQQNNSIHQTVLVISDRPDALGLQKAKSHGCKSLCIPLPEIEDKKKRRVLHEQSINQILHDYDIELIVLSGYMRILTPDFVKPWAGRILNIHPSLLPDFPGAHAHRDVIAAKANITGCTVHFVDSGMDTGPIIRQEKVAVHPDDDETTLANRVKEVEHKLYPAVIDLIASGEIQSP